MSAISSKPQGELFWRMENLSGDLQSHILDMLPREELLTPWFDLKYEKLKSLVAGHFERKGELRTIKLLEEAIFHNNAVPTVKKAAKKMLEYIEYAPGSVKVMCFPIFDGPQYILSASSYKKSENPQIINIVLTKKISSPICPKRMKWLSQRELALTSEGEPIQLSSDQKKCGSMGPYRVKKGFEQLEAAFIGRIWAQIPPMVDRSLLRAQDTDFLSEEFKNINSSNENLLKVLWADLTRRGESQFKQIIDHLFAAIIRHNIKRVFTK